MIESCGVPHTEVEAILVDHRPVGLEHIVEEAVAIEVYPVDVTAPADAIPRLRPELRLPLRFVIDSNLGRLARYLRLLGFDSLYSNRYTDHEVAQLAADQQRVVLTRDRFLLQHRIITWGYFVRQVNPGPQLQEVADRFDLREQARPFSRCTLCNTELLPVDKSRILHRLEPRTIRYYDHFRRCPECDRIYWPGTHYQRALALVESV